MLRGHCFEQFGAGEPYLPVWEAIDRAAKEEPGSPLAALVARHAAAVSPEAEPPPPGNPPVDAHAALAQRLLRDLSDAIEALAADKPVVLVLEDAHWVDHSTLDLLSALARRRGRARLMLVATYRPTDALAAAHPLREVVRELLAARLAEEVALGPLDESAVAEYVAKRFPGGGIPGGSRDNIAGREGSVLAPRHRDGPTATVDLARRLHQRTDGHPLFLVHLLDDLAAHALAGEAWADALETRVPRTVRAMIESQLERLSPDQQRVLEAAAVTGVECSAAAVAGALGDDLLTVERTCDALARQNTFITARGCAEWPDGTVSSQHRFVHELYHHVVSDRLGVARRAQLHRALGLRLEAGWGGPRGRAVGGTVDALRAGARLAAGGALPSQRRRRRGAALRAPRGGAVPAARRCRAGPPAAGGARGGRAADAAGAGGEPPDR